jgi:hypothetical protein
MKADTKSQAPGTSSFGGTADSLRSEAILKLGKKIVAELGGEESRDTLACWMSHYIAELIHAAETTTGEDRRSVLEACTTAILELWKYRAHFPSGMGPFEKLEPILRALESLDPNAHSTRYFSTTTEKVESEGDGEEVRQWLTVAKGIDYSAKLLIRYCLARASECALDKSKEWVTLAEAAGGDEGIDFRVIRFVAAELDLLSSESLEDETRKLTEDRCKRLEAVQDLLSQLLVDLRRRLES